MINEIKHTLRIKELELNSILEITQAINNNFPEDSLYKIYNFTLRANLNISKLALYILDANSQWQCKVFFGTESNFSREIFNIQQLNSIETIPLAHITMPAAF